MAGVALMAAPAALGLEAVPAWGDQPVVRATIYAGSQGAPQTVTVTNTQLNGSCPEYGGASPSPFTLEPSGQPYQPAAGNSWTLGTVVACGLNVPSGALNAVQVQSPTRGGETPLTAADLVDPTRYHDATAPDALPVVSIDGGNDQVSYARPLRGPGDQNGADHFAGSGPISIDVFENAPPLQVQIVPIRRSSASGTVRDRFTVTATDQSGQVVPASSLGAAWSFGDGSTSRVLQPIHTFTAAGSYFVTVTVSDVAAGTGGTRTIAVPVDSRALTGNANRSGAGHDRTPTSNSGTVHGAGTSAQGSPGTRRHRSQNTTVTNPNASPSPTTTPAAAATPTAARPTTSPPAAAPAPSTRPRPSSAPRRRQPRTRAHARSTPKAKRRPATAARHTALRLITGQLVASVHPVSAAASPLARPAATATPAAVVGAATRVTSAAGWLAALAVAALLALGAAREYRGHRRRRLRPPA